MSDKGTSYRSETDSVRYQFVRVSELTDRESERGCFLIMSWEFVAIRTEEVREGEILYIYGEGVHSVTVTVTAAVAELYINTYYKRVQAPVQ